MWCIWVNYLSPEIITAGTQPVACVLWPVACGVGVHWCLRVPRQASVMAARWTECMAVSGLLLSARTNWKLRIPPIRPQIQQAENTIIWGRVETDRWTDRWEDGWTNRKTERGKE